MASVEAILILFFIFIGWPAVVIIYKSKWGNRNVLYRRKHLESIEARHPFCVSTKKLSERQLYDLIKQKLPDPDLNETGSICLLNQVDGMKTNENQLLFAVVGDWWKGGRAGNIKTTNGRNRPTSIRMAVIVDHNNDEAIVTLRTLKWTERTGIFERYKDLIRAQDKMLHIVKQLDPQAETFTEG